MYDPETGRFLSRDPMMEGPKLVYSHEYVARRARRLNPYTYVENNPVNLVDPSGLETFYLCQRRVRGGVAGACNCQHADIYGDTSGEIYQGFLGPVPLSNAGLPGEGYKCMPLYDSDADIVEGLASAHLVPKTFRWGPKAGKPCKGAISADIIACLQAKPKPPGTPGVVSNCQTDAYDAIEGCCLTGFHAPATTVPVNFPPGGFKP